MAYVIVVALLLAVVFTVSSPWRHRTILGAELPDVLEIPADPERVELEAARDAKYREIRDAELDHETGKLSDADYTAIDSNLRAEAIDILRRLDEVSGHAPDSVVADPRSA